MSQFFQGVTSGSLPPSVPTSFITDSGTVIPAGNIVNMNGTNGITVIANPNGSNNMVFQLVAGSLAYTNVTSAMSPYTVLSTDYFISVDATGGPVIINLPDAPTSNQEFIIKDRLGKASTNSITVKSLSGVTTVDGQASYVFSDNYESLDVIYHSANYEGF